MPATITEHAYSTGRPFWTVACNECGVVLNSGHHYDLRNRHHAEALAAQHNVEHHADELRRAALERDLADEAWAASLPHEPYEADIHDCGGAETCFC